MYLTFGGASANRAPGNQVANILWRDHVQKLTAGRQTQAIDVNQQLTCNAQSFVNAVGFVQVRVIDQAFPADGCAGLFKVHAHDNFKRPRVFFALLNQAACIL